MSKGISHPLPPIFDGDSKINILESFHLSNQEKRCFSMHILKIDFGKHLLQYLVMKCQT